MSFTIISRESTSLWNDSITRTPLVGTTNVDFFNVRLLSTNLVGLVQKIENNAKTLSSSNGTSRVQALAWTWVRILPRLPRGTTQVVTRGNPTRPGSSPDSVIDLLNWSTVRITEAHVAAVLECQVADCSTRYNHWLVIRANDWYVGSEVADSRRLRGTRRLVEKGITKVSMMRYQVRIPSQ
ncbi:hypothetical protein Tco_0037741 [Tanacetum coccineum]